MCGLDPFVAVAVGVDAPPTGAWLRDVIAAHHGIAMQTDFPLTGAAVADGLAEALGFDEAHQKAAEAWKPGALTWHILELLWELSRETDESPALATLRTYLGPTTGQAGQAGHAARAWSLATRIAATFDRYLIHRPTLVAEWLHNAVGDEADALWQAELMRRLGLRLGLPVHRLWAARGFGATFTKAAPFQTPGEGRPLYAFAVTALPTAILYWLWLTAHTRDVTLYLRSPIAELPNLGDDDGLAGGRELAATLRSMAGGVTQVEGTLMALDAGERTLEGCPLPFAAFGLPSHLTSLPAPTVDIEPCDEVALAGGTLLGVIQRTLFGGADAPPNSEKLVYEIDLSLQLHACYGAVRQAEVLRELILGLLSDDVTLQPRDILILSPDIEAHAPLLEAAFGAGKAPDSARDGPPRLPLRVMGRSAWRTNPYADLVVRLIRLASGRATLTEVLDLLALDSVRLRFGLEEGDLARCRDLLVDAGARWGLDAGHRVSFGLPESDEYTWSFVLNRIILGVVCAEDSELIAWPDEAHVVAPITGLEGGDLEWLGGIIAFIRALRLWLPRITADAAGGGRGARKAADWVRLIVGEPAPSAEATGLLFAFGAPAEDRWQWEELLAGLEVMETATAELEALLLPDAFMMALEALFDEPVKGTLGSPSAAGVTLASMGIAAGLPARVVVLFGFDQDAWPRVGDRPGFDLMARHPHPGDPDQRRNQRGTFVDAIMQAEETLIITYSGKDPISDKPLDPAVVVLDLIAGLDTSGHTRDGGPVSTAITRHHPLQPFSEANFLASAPFSHDRGLLAAALSRRTRGGEAARAPVQEPSRPSAPDFARPTLTLRLGDIDRDLRDPAKAFFRESLGIYRGSAGGKPRQDREPLGLGRPEDGGSGKAWEVWQTAAYHDSRTERVRRDVPDLDLMTKRFRALGVLPLGEAGERTLRQLSTFVSEQHAVFESEFGSYPEEALPVRVAVDLAARAMPGLEFPPAVVIEDVVFARRGDAVVGLTRSKPFSSYLLPLWVKALALSTQAGQGSGESRGISKAVLVGKKDPGKDGKGNIAQVVSFPLAVASPFSPAELLSDLVTIALASRLYPVPLFSKASYAFVDRLKFRKGDKNTPPAGISDAVFVDAINVSGGRVDHYWVAVLARCVDEDPQLVERAFSDAWDKFGGDGAEGYKIKLDLEGDGVAALFGELTSLDANEDPRAAVVGAGPAWTFAVIALRVWGPIIFAEQLISAGGEETR